MSWQWKMEVGTFQSLLQGLVAATISFIVFAFGSLLVAIQVASAQLSPRIIATTLLRDNTIRLVVALFVLTLGFGLGTLVRSQAHVQYLLLSVRCPGRHLERRLHLPDRLRGAAAAAGQHRVAAGRTGIGGPRAGLSCRDQRKAHTVQAAPTAEVREDRRRIMARPVSSWRSIWTLAGRPSEPTASSSLPVASATSSPWGASVPASRWRRPGGRRVLRAAVAFGPERTIEQDANFVFRVIVVIAIKALSNAINDQTTAVLALDQLHRLLRAVGRRHLHDDVIRDSAGSQGDFRIPD